MKEAKEVGQWICTALGFLTIITFWALVATIFWIGAGSILLLLGKTVVTLSRKEVGYIFVALWLYTLVIYLQIYLGKTNRGGE